MTTFDRSFARARECIEAVRVALAIVDDREAIGSVCDAVEAYDDWWLQETGGESPFHPTIPHPPLARLCGESEENA